MFNKTPLKFVLNTPNHTFIKFLDCLVNYPQLTLIDRVVYCAILTYSRTPKYKGPEDGGISFPWTKVSDEAIAKRLGIPESDVSASIAHLEELGIISTSIYGKKRIAIFVLKDFEKLRPEDDDDDDEDDEDDDDDDDDDDEN